MGLSHEVLFVLLNIFSAAGLVHVRSAWHILPDVYYSGLVHVLLHYRVLQFNVTAFPFLCSRPEYLVLNRIPIN
jgi:hypothetical protein